jgi:hypothetical protein
LYAKVATLESGNAASATIAQRCTSRRQSLLAEDVSGFGCIIYPRSYARLTNTTAEKPKYLATLLFYPINDQQEVIAEASAF